MVLHTGGLHWVCVSNVGCCKANQVKLYGSLYSGILNFTKQHAALLFVEGNEKTEVIIPPAAQQSNGTDCGVLPLAFATALCFQLDTSSLKFNMQACSKGTPMEKALDEGYMDMSPYEELSREDTTKVFYITIYSDYNSSKQQMAE